PYENNSGVLYATTQPIAIGGLSYLQLSFERWLGGEESIFDHACIQFSVDGGPWTTLWSNTDRVKDTSWTYVSYLIPASGNSLKLRWYLGTTDESYIFAGWNIDDVQVTGVRSTLVPATDEYTVSLIDGNPDSRTVEVTEGA